MTRDSNTPGGVRYSDRRQFLWQFGGGLGGIALASLLNHEGLLAAPPGRPQFPAKAKRVVQLFMSGAASQCDTFDYKPRLIRDHGKKWDPGEKVELFQSSPGQTMKAPWKWRKYGQMRQMDQRLRRAAGSLRG